MSVQRFLFLFDEEIFDVFTRFLFSPYLRYAFGHNSNNFRFSFVSGCSWISHRWCQPDLVALLSEGRRWLYTDVSSKPRYSVFVFRIESFPVICSICCVVHESLFLWFCFLFIFLKEFLPHELIVEIYLLILIEATFCCFMLSSRVFSSPFHEFFLFCSSH